MEPEARYTLHIQWQRLEKAYWEKAAFGTHYLPEKIHRVFQAGGFELPPLTYDEVLAFAAWCVEDYGLDLGAFDVYDEKRTFVPWTRIL